MAARRISRPSSRMKLRPSVIARTFPVPATSNRQAVNGRPCVRADAVERTTAPTMPEIQQNRARATCQRPPIQQRNRRNGAALRRCALYRSRVVLLGAVVVYFAHRQARQGALMKIVEIVPRARARLYGTLVAKEAAIRKSGRGTYVRVGRKSQHAARWKHKKFKGTLQLNRGASEAVTAKVRAATPEDERKLLSSFLGFVDRHAGDQVTTITIHYR